VHNTVKNCVSKSLIAQINQRLHSSGGNMAPSEECVSELGVQLSPVTKALEELFGIGSPLHMWISSAERHHL
jgi:hypothetical protein